MLQSRSIAKGKVQGRCLTANGTVIIKTFEVGGFPDGKFELNFSSFIWDPTDLGNFYRNRQDNNIFTILAGVLTSQPSQLWGNGSGGVTPPVVTALSDGTRILIQANPEAEDVLVDVDFCLRYSRDIDLNKKTFTEPAPCFLAGTLVGTPEGLIPIEELKIGQQIYSFDIDNDEIVPSEVAKLMERKTNHYYELVVAGELINVTGEHPFYIPSGETFVPVKQLMISDEVQQFDGPDLAVTQNTLLQAFDTTVYNLTVDNMHNYFVGKRGLLVHNK